MTQKIHSEEDIDIIIGWIFGNDASWDCGYAEHVIDEVKCLGNFVKNKVSMDYLLAEDVISTILEDIYRNTVYFKNKDVFHKGRFYEDHFIVWEDERGILASSEKRMEILKKHLKPENN